MANKRAPIRTARKISVKNKHISTQQHDNFKRSHAKDEGETKDEHTHATIQSIQHSNSYTRMIWTVVVSAIGLCVLSYFVLPTLHTAHTDKKTHIHLRVAFKPKMYITCNKCARCISHSPHIQYIRHRFTLFSSHICVVSFFYPLYFSIHSHSFVLNHLCVYIRMHVGVHVKLLLLLCTRSAG